MEDLLPECLHLIYDVIDAITFEALACASSHMYNLACEVNSPPMRQSFSFSDEGCHSLKDLLTQRQCEFIRAGYIHLVPSVLIEQLTLGNKIILHMYDHIRELYEKNELALPADHNVLLELINYLTISADFVYWFLTVPAAGPNYWFIDAPAVFLYDHIINNDSMPRFPWLLLGVFFTYERHDRLVQFFHDKVPGAFDLIMGKPRNHPYFARTFMERFDTAITNGRLDTLQWLYQLLPHIAKERCPPLSLYTRTHPRIQDSSVIRFLLENDISRPTFSDLIAVAMTSENASKDVELVEKHLKLDVRDSGSGSIIDPFFSSVQNLQWITVSAYQQAKGIAERYDRSTEFTKYAKSMLENLVTNGTNYSLMVYLKAEEKLPTSRWPYKFFSQREVLRGQDMKCFKFLLAQDYEEWKEFVQGVATAKERYRYAQCLDTDDFANLPAYVVIRGAMVKDNYTVADVYNFIRRAGEEDMGLQRAWRREVGQHCTCCTGACRR